MGLLCGVWHGPRDGRELIYAVGQLNTSATLWRRQMEMPSSVTAKRIEGVEEGSLEPVIARHSPADNMRMAYNESPSTRTSG